jgi:predicted ribosome quality control (RQC) complex YloA/Tae2 family protein
MLRMALSRGILLFTAVLLAGCFNLQVDEPLVNLGEDEHQKEKVRDPAPGVPDSELNREQLLQRELAKCQYLLEIAEKKNKKLKDQYEDEKDRLEDQIEHLEDENEDLLKENRKLRKELRD